VRRSTQLFLLVATAAINISTLNATETKAQIRLNQAGFPANDNKQALLMATVSESNTTFQVVSSDGTVALTVPVGNKIGSWNTDYTNVYLLDFSFVKKPGIYSIKVDGAVPAVSPSFRIGTGSEVYAPLLRNSLFFFQAQRDGPDVVPAVINRKPSHLTDKQAFVYKVPAFGKNGMQGSLEKISGSMDVSGGWFDAGDYLKFVETASYVTAMMLQTARDYPAQAGRDSADFAAEGRFGLNWLLKMWNDETKTLYVQVGIGDGNQNMTGDHDVWRLPEADDKLNVKIGSPEYFIKYRPVFPAGPAGASISPNLAGRLTAAFALGYQVFKTTDPAYAQKLLLTAEHIFDLAATTNVSELTSTFPRTFYPEDTWRDDMEWGAIELYFALADGNAPTNLPDSNPTHCLQLAAHWARAHLDSGNGDSLNLYDVSSVAHYELCRAMDKSGTATGLEVSRTELLSTFKKQLDSAFKRSEKDPFGLGFRYSGGDLIPHVLGLVLEAGFYDDLTHTTTYADFAQRQLDFVLGANAWGTSFIVGAGTVFPFHMQHQIANLAGSLDGTPPIVLGATVDGPTRGRSSKGGGVPDGARATPWPGGKNPFAPFSGNGVQYTDDVSSWATVEPADDYTIPTVLIFARLANQ
jgi:endoglucanase